MARQCWLIDRRTGCLNKTWTFFENAITPLFTEETFPDFLWEKKVDTPLYQCCLLSRVAADRK